jgi:hypothetical protein
MIISLSREVIELNEFCVISARKLSQPAFSTFSEAKDLIRIRLNNEFHRRC